MLKEIQALLRAASGNIKIIITDADQDILNKEIDESEKFDESLEYEDRKARIFYNSDRHPGDFFSADLKIIKAPKNNELPETMRLDSPKGSVVIPLFKNGEIMNGYDYDKEFAQKCLKENQEYTVEYIGINEWSSAVTLKEFPNKAFNTVHFRNK